MGERLCSGRWDFYFYFIVLLTTTFLSWMSVGADSVPASSRYKEVTSVVGSVGQIPCTVTSFDDVVMILWFKGSSGAPIYSYDARNEEIEPRHMTLKDDWGLRLYFRVWPNKKRHPALMIQDLKTGDGGLYRCRVDYRNSPTTNSVTRLKIIEPPTRLEVRDTSPSRPISDQQIFMAGNKPMDPSVTYLGPYTEGQNVTLVCSAYGGKPSPEVRWYKNAEVVDTSYSLTGTEYTINEMTINNLGRDHTFDVFSCQASNNNETQALTHKVQLEIYLGVTNVELEVPSPMTAGSEYNIVCKTMGAYPTVKVEFWKNLKRIASRSQMKSVADNMTFTSILYKPEVMDDETTIICKAENPWVSKKPSVARKSMKIKYSPVAVLRLGRNRTEAFSEGESVLMECHVKANPPAHTIHWFHQGRQLSGNETTGVRINGRTLFISYLKYHVGGDYNCEAVNNVGKGISNTLPIELHLTPKCVTSEAAQVPLAVGETQWLTCNVLAWPSDLNFYWTLNRSDRTSNGEIKSIGRNLTEHRLPISSNARGNNNVTTKMFATSTNSTSSSNLEQEAEQRYENQNGYPQLSSGSSSESLDYPEDQHMPHVSSTNTTTVLVRSGSKSTMSNKEKRSNQKDIISSQETYSNIEEKGILKKETEKSMTHYSSDVVFSKSNASPSPLPDSYSLNGSSVSISKHPFSTSSAELTSDISSSESGSKDERKSKRHVYPSSTQYGLNGKSRDLGLSAFQDRIRHTSLLSYQVRSDEDYGTVACWATNSLGNQVFPCLFHIIKREEEVIARSSNKKQDDRKEKGRKTKENNITDKEQSAKTRNLTASSSTPVEKEIVGRSSSSSESESMDAQQGFSKLQKTLGIVLLLILIFIAGLTGLVFSMLFVLAKRRREIRRIVIAHGPHVRNGNRRRSSGHCTTSSSSVFSRRGSNNITNKTEKGSATVNKNFGENPASIAEESGGENAFLPSSDKLAITSSIDPFQEIAGETNIGKPKLSCSSTDMATTTSSCAGCANNDSFPNNIEEERAYVIPRGEPFIQLLPNSSTFSAMSPQLQFADREQEPEVPEGFKSMTPRALELFGSEQPSAIKQHPELAYRDDDCSTADNNAGEYQTHLDKDRLLVSFTTEQHQ